MKKQTRQRAIRFTCLECAAWSRSVVRNCRNRDCPLWVYRSGRCEIDPQSGYFRENGIDAGKKSAGTGVNGGKTHAVGVSERKKVQTSCPVGNGNGTFYVSRNESTVARHSGFYFLMAIRK